MGPARPSLGGGNPGFEVVAALLFFRSSSAFISRAFSGVMEGVFGTRIVGDIIGLERALEFVDGRPPLV
jgi:hypothetical protein